MDISIETIKKWFVFAAKTPSMKEILSLRENVYILREGLVGEREKSQRLEEKLSLKENTITDGCIRWRYEAGFWHTLCPNCYIQLVQESMDLRCTSCNGTFNPPCHTDVWKEYWVQSGRGRSTSEEPELIIIPKEFKEKEYALHKRKG